MAKDLPRPVFLLGVRASGAHLLHLCLSKHPQISPLRKLIAHRAHTRTTRSRPDDELAPPIEDKSLPRKLRGDEHIEFFGHPAYQPRYRLTEADIASGDREALLATWKYGMLEPGRRMLESTPPNLLRTRFLQALFPDAHFVIVVREPYANVAAVARDRLQWGTIEQLALHWAAAHETFLADRRFLKRRIIIRYEQMVQEPARTLEAICRHCRLDVMPDLAEDVAWNPEQNQRLIGQLDARDLRIITRTCGRTMVRLGYGARDKWGIPKPPRIKTSSSSTPAHETVDARQAA